jgi:hypothetical protein
MFWYFFIFFWVLNLLNFVWIGQMIKALVVKLRGVNEEYVKKTL